MLNRDRGRFAAAALDTLFEKHLGGFSPLNGDCKMADRRTGGNMSRRTQNTQARNERQRRTDIFTLAPPNGTPRQTCRSYSIDKMATLIRHGSRLQCLWGSATTLLRNTIGPHTDIVRTLKIKTRRTRVLVRKFEWDGKSLAARGFLRPIKSYTPTADVSERLDKICKNEGLSSDDSTKIDDPVQRFNIFVACEKEFDYPLASSILHTIETIGDLRKFYVTPIDASVPFEALRKAELPKNLHVLYEYNRFHPDDDTKFGGKTAFPKSSTLVTGLKYKKKYRGLEQPQTYPF